MKQYFLKKDNNPSLILFFGGWGSWPGLFSEMPFPEGYDVLLCYDYRTLDFDFSLLSGYGSIRLVAWSMGVWAASSVLSGVEAKWEKSIAVNGTMFPIDDTRGIPADIFNGTLDNMSEAVLSRFNRRMCGKDLQYFRSRGQDRPAEELKEELAALKDAVVSSGPGRSCFRWDVAVAGTGDLIFPVANQLNAWRESGTHIIEVETSHYGRELFCNVLSGRLVDKELMKQRFSRAVETYGTAAAVQEAVAGKMASMLSGYAGAGNGSVTGVGKIFEAGCGTGLLTRKFLERFRPEKMWLNDICVDYESCLRDVVSENIIFTPGDAESIQLPQGLDMVISCSALQWFHDPKSFIGKASAALSAGGILAFSTFGEKNLREIKTLEGIALNYMPAEDLMAALPGYMTPVVVEEDEITMYFDSAVSVLRHLKDTGVTGIRKSFWTPGRLADFDRRYRDMFAGEDGRLPLTYHPVWLMAKNKKDIL